MKGMRTTGDEMCTRRKITQYVTFCQNPLGPWLALAVIARVRRVLRKVGLQSKLKLALIHAEKVMTNPPSLTTDFGIAMSAAMPI